MASLHHLSAISFSHRNAGLDARDALSFKPHEAHAFVERSQALGFQEAAVLSTCNRTEFYLVGASTSDPWQTIAPLVAEVRDLSPEDLPTPDSMLGNAAARHLFRVSASLESVALGENEILGQVKEVHQRILQRDRRAPILDQLFQYAIRVGKQVRTDTQLCQGALSVASAAVDLATKIFGDVSERQVLIVGAGDTAEKTAMHFSNAGAAQFQVINRSRERGRQLADDFDAQYRPLDDLMVACREADVAVFATGARDHLLTREQLRKVMPRRQHRPIFLIDISNPRNVDPEVNRLDSVFLYNMDDLQQVVESNLASRRQEIPRATAIIDHMVNEWEQWRRSQEVTPTIASLAQFFDQVRAEEIDRQYNGISDEKRQMLDDFSRGLVKKLLHNPIMYLRQAVDENSLSTEDLQLVRSLYDLDSFQQEKNQ